MLQPLVTPLSSSNYFEAWEVFVVMSSIILVAVGKNGNTAEFRLYE
jgi:hypothetical protein